MLAKGKTYRTYRIHILDLCKTSALDCQPGGNMPEKQDKQVVKHGDVSQRVGVEVIRNRGVDVDKLIKMLVANAGAEFASTD